MKYTIINEKAEYLTNESFWSLKNKNPRYQEPTWIAIRGEIFEQYTDELCREEGIPFPVDFSCSFYKRGVPVFSPEVQNLLLILEELVGTRGFEIVPHPGYVFEYTFAPVSKCVIQWATQRGDKRSTVLCTTLLESPREPEPPEPFELEV